MKYIKAYEDIKGDPEVGDYVYCETDIDQYTPDKFVGIVNAISIGKKYKYRVKYPIDLSLPEDPDRSDRHIRRDEIKDFSKTYKELEKYDLVNKFNI